VEEEGLVWLIVNMVNSPVERKDARWRELDSDEGGDWSRARAVIWVDTL
jgi:hypothetical protein